MPAYDIPSPPDVMALGSLQCSHQDGVEIMIRWVTSGASHSSRFRFFAALRSDDGLESLSEYPTELELLPATWAVTS